MAINLFGKMPVRREVYFGIVIILCTLLRLLDNIGGGAIS